ncbi:hypothetical protein RB195_015005 [Necator americanus]|uniref:Uncharacterized protein n=1 Tax=Necator americanus TaxID=51031 RepID=A0ABR1E2J4_NECAM
MPSGLGSRNNHFDARRAAKEEADDLQSSPRLRPEEEHLLVGNPKYKSSLRRRIQFRPSISYSRVGSTVPEKESWTSTSTEAPFGMPERL